jgi:hypothetical protein
MLELLRAATFNHGRHRLERAVFRLRKSTQISMRHGRVVAPAGREKMPMPVEEGRERRANRLHQRHGQPSSRHTVT